MAVENHLIQAAESVAVSRGKGEQKDVTGRSTGNDSHGVGSSSSSDDMKGCMFWEIYLKAPFLVKNCLPCSLAITIETSAGIISKISVPEASLH
jgi:hypothetical protein